MSKSLEPERITFLKYPSLVYETDSRTGLLRAPTRVADHRAQILSPSLTHCVTLAKRLNPAVPQFPPL